MVVSQIRIPIEEEQVRIEELAVVAKHAHKHLDRQISTKRRACAQIRAIALMIISSERLAAPPRAKLQTVTGLISCRHVNANQSELGASCGIRAGERARDAVADRATPSTAAVWLSSFPNRRPGGWTSAESTRPAASPSATVCGVWFLPSRCWWRRRDLRSEPTSRCRRYAWWAVFSCRSVAGFTCPPRQRSDRGFVSLCQRGRRYRTRTR